MNEQLSFLDAEPKLGDHEAAQRLPGGESMTAYYNCDAEEKAAEAHHFHSDAMLDVVLNNVELIKQEMEALDDAVGD